MTGQVDFDSHTNTVLDAALGVVNAVVPGERRGRPHPAPADPVAAVGAALKAANSAWSEPPDRSAAESLAGYASRMHRVVAAASAGTDTGMDTACDEVNRLLRETGATPVLARHDGEPWHLHFHAPEAPWDISWAASMATALAIVLGEPAAERLGLCTAPACDRAYLDVSRNGTRRFCSTACQNRVKTAAFRARNSARPPKGTGAEG
ncbi:CGNR zinc finger domain-containing protein [Actinokineospora guangxiensis]|uniref:CGNR zinc finger domain-containing protein n=1 Tax=Actinokineospora guangxiensis TaxID=1490288 RepID=A0ABW0EZ06_9PSEU